jgi:glycosyltransferase involved in cell wall biosynthesis
MEYGIPPGKILFSKNGHQVSHFSAFEKRKSDRVRFGYVGTLIPTKGAHVLIEAFNGVRSGEAELKVYGRFLPYGGFEDYPDLLPRLVRNERIRFLGEYQHSQISDIMAEIDVLVVPSIWHENSPLTIHEAFLAKTPVIASNIGGMAELVQDGVNGLLFKVGDIADLRKKITMIVQHPDLISKLSANIGPVKTIEETAVEVEKIYQDLIAQFRAVC